MFRDMPRVLRCLASIPMLFWAAITDAAGKPAGKTGDRSSPQHPEQYYADDPWVD